ncbi:MGDG synthase family glycosyltransferase [Streptomyces sp. NPDC054844]
MTRATPGDGRRLLVISASMGAGHDTVAAELVRRARERGDDALVVDVLALLPYGLGSALRHFYRGSVRHFPWAYAALYRLFLRPGAGRRPGGTPLARLAGGRLRELVESTGADVVVPVFHLGAQLTGHLRARGLLTVPSVVLVIDFALHRQWLHSGNDHHLCLTEQAAREVRESTGSPAWTCGPVVAPEFFADAPSAPGAGDVSGVSGGAGVPGAGDEPGAAGVPDVPGPADVPDAPGAAGWRGLFDRLGPGRPAVVLSAGAWGVGSHLDVTVRLLTDHGFLPVVLCGDNERLRRDLSGTPGVVALGWVTDMPGLLHAARALVDNAAGQTAVQALAAGLPVVGYRPIPGHGADGVRRMAALGVSDVAEDGTGLLGALRRLTAPGSARRERIAAGRALFTDDAVARACAVADAWRACR